MAGLVVLLTLAPGAAGTALAQAEQPRMEQRAAGGCDTTKALTLMGNAVGMLPGSGQLASLFGLLGNIANLTGCDGITIEQITAIAHAQAKLVYENATLDAAVEKVEDQFEQFTSLKTSYDGLTTDKARSDLVTSLDTMWRLISDNEHDVTGLSFQALPALASIASLKLSVLTAAHETETLSVGRWRTLAKARVDEAKDSDGYLTALESQLNEYVNGRFRPKRENISYVCNRIFCTRTYRLFAYDSVTGGKSAVTVLKDVAGKRDPGYDAAWAKAVKQVDDRKAGIRNPFITPGYKAIRAGLRAHANLPVPPVFQLREEQCNLDQYMILQSAKDPELVVTALDGPVAGSRLGLTSGLAAAKNNPNAQFTPIRYGSNWIYKIRTADLTMNAWNGDNTGVPMVLFGGVEYAKEHTNSLFATYINSANELIFKVSSRDHTIGLHLDENGDTRLVLGGTLNAALNDPDARFKFTCWPQARR